MATELMRIIDYWIGVPLCCLLAILHRFICLFGFKRKEQPHPKILFIKLSEMGAIILSFSLLKRIRQMYPGSEIFFLTFKKNKPLIEVLNVVKPENILTIAEDSPREFVVDTFKAIKQIKRERVDIVFDLELFSRFTAILTYLSGAGKRIGFYRYHFEGLYRGNLLTHNVQYNPLIHTSIMLLSLAQVVKLAVKNTPEMEAKIENAEIVQPKFIVPKESIEQMRQRLNGLGIGKESRIFLMNPGDGVLPLREWPQSYYVSLIKKILAADIKNYVIQIGTGGVSKKTQEICDSVGDKRCLDLTNKTRFIELMSLFEIGYVLIANDCGLAHISSLTSIRKFIIFGPESPRLYSPLGENSWVIYSDFPCSPCVSTFNHRKTACQDNRCLKVISPEQVYDFVQKTSKE